MRLVGTREAVEILEVRAVLEALAARHAAANAAREDVEDLEAILAEMRRRLNAGDLLTVDMRDTSDGLKVTMNDHSTGQSGSMTASPPLP